MERVCSVCGCMVGKEHGSYVTIEVLTMCHGIIFWSRPERWIKKKEYFCKTCWEKRKEE